MSFPRFAPLLVLLALGCSKPEDAAKKSEPVKAEGEGETGAGEAPGSTTSSTGASETETETEEEDDGSVVVPDEFDAIGIAVCDDFVKAYLACIDGKVPEAEREALRKSLAENHASWKQTKAGGDSAAKGLQVGCKAAREQAKAATAAYACEW